MTTTTWTGLAGDGNWNTAGNWGSATVPIAGDDLVFTGAVDITNHVDSSVIFGSLDFSTYSGTIKDTLIPSDQAILAFARNCTLSAGMNASFLRLNAQGSAATQTFTTAGQTIFAFYRSGSADLTIVGGLSVVPGDPSMVELGSVGTVTLGGDIATDAFETDGANIVQGGYTITVRTSTSGNGLFLEGACTWTWSGGAQIILAPAAAVELDVYVDAVVTPSLPPVFVNGAGTAKLFDGNLTCQTFLVVAGSWDANGNVVIQTGTLWTDTSGDHQWDNASNWTGGVPDATVDALIRTGTLVQANLTVNAKSIDFTGFTGTFDSDTHSPDLNVYGNVTLGAGMSFTGYTFFVFKASGTWLSNGATGDILEFNADGAGIVVTLGDDADVQGAEAHNGATIALGAHTLHLHNGPYLDLSTGGILSWTSGAKIVAVTTAAGGGVTLHADDGASFPPVEATGDSGAPSGAVFGIGVNAVGVFSVNVESVLVDNINFLGGDTQTIHIAADLTMQNGAELGYNSAFDLTVGGNLLVTSGNLATNYPHVITVTGTAVAHNATIAACDFSGGTTLDATDNCVDGGGNTNVDFGAPSSGVAQFTGFFG